MKETELPQLLEIIEAQPRPNSPDAVDVDPNATSYDRHRERMAANQRKKSAAGRDIGTLPAVVDQSRRDACERDLKRFAETYFPETFVLEWSEDHLDLIAQIQTAVLIGGTQAFAMPRGTGKTSLCLVAVIWSAVYGHHLYTMLIHANGDKAADSIEMLQFEFETNEQLQQDFPEVCFPIAQLERVAQRAKGQTYNGKPTFLNWSGDQLRMPNIPGAKSAGAVISVHGLQEAVRGALKFHPPTRRKIRPTLVLVDDFQTRDSAKSFDESVKRLRIVTSDVMGMVGPGQSLSVLVPSTIIEPGDAMAQLVDREQFPEWRGRTCKLLYQFPEDLELWEQYNAIRLRCLKQHDDKANPDASKADIYKEAIDFYKKNRKAMDAGAVAQWPQRREEWELSAIQNAMNLYFRDPIMFWTEYQNDPLSALDQDSERLSQTEIAAKLSGFDRLDIPEDCQNVTAFIDVHKRILYYSVAAWTPGFTGYIIDYGAFPKPRVPFFTERTTRPTLAEQFPKRGVEAAIYAGLEELVAWLFSRPLNRVDGARMHIGLCLIDSAWKPDPVFKYCTASPFAGRVAPSLGRSLGPNERALSTCKPRKGEHIGLEWTIPATHGKQCRQIQYDTNFWKTFFHARLATPHGDAGALSLFGRMEHNRPNVDHGFYARHLDAEYSLPVTGRRTVDEWKLRPGENQNHWFDTAVGCTVAASVIGSTIISPTLPPKKRLRNSR